MPTTEVATVRVQETSIVHKKDQQQQEISSGNYLRMLNGGYERERMC